MEKVILLLPALLSFFIALFLTPLWIKKAKEIGLVWEDMNKPQHPKDVAGSGGTSAFLGFILGVLSYIGIKTFYLKSENNLIEIFVSLSMVLIVAFIGFMDDLFGWKKGGLSMRSRLILLAFSSIPLIVINAGESRMMGIELGLFFPLFFIPLGIVGASATFNFLAGYNGLEASQGIIVLSALAIVTSSMGEAWLSLIALCMVASLLAFYIFNKYPAKVFPGNILTYSVEPVLFTIGEKGWINETMLQAGTFMVRITVADIHGLSDEQEVRIIVE